MQMRNLAAMAAIIVATSPCLAGGSPGYYQAPYYGPDGAWQGDGNGECVN
jgi:hypothetical protein